MPEVEGAGVALHYAERGDGRPLLIVHAMASDARAWAATLDELAAAGARADAGAGADADADAGAGADAERGARVGRARASYLGFFADYAGQASWSPSRRELRAIAMPVAVVTGPLSPRHIVAAADA